MTNPAPILVIVGPTAGGKSALAMALARALPGECISADSMQIYRGMDIGTAKPTAAERSEIPHHLIDLVEPDDDGFTVDAWLERATATADEIRRRGRTPIVVGGTNLYVRALLEGLFEGPEPDPALRAALEALPISALREELVRVDPPSAARIHPNDLRRTVRALEVFRQTGTPLSTLQTQWSADVRQNARRDAIVVGLEWPVDAINRRINARVKEMMAAGFLDEVRTLAARGLGRQAREAVGYGELLEHLAGRVSLEDAIEAIKIRTRRYAKQQRTWLRRFRALERSCWLDASVEPMDAWPARVLAHVRAHACA
jgi:tRNA dimethylallyltransferase